MSGLTILVTGALTSGGIAWQVVLMRLESRKNRKPRRVYVPIVFAAIVLVGVVVVTGIQVIDPDLTVASPEQIASWRSGSILPRMLQGTGLARLWDFWIPLVWPVPHRLLAALLFGTILVLKAYFGPAFTGLYTSWIAYVWMEVGEFEPKVLFDFALSLLVSESSEALELAYFAMTFLYVVGASAFDTVKDATSSALSP